MSKGAQKAIYILIALLVVVIIFSALTMVQKMSAVEARNKLEAQLQKAEEREVKQAKEVKTLKDDIAALTEQNVVLDKQAKEATGKVDGLIAKVDEANSERDKWKQRIDVVRVERDELLASVQELKKKQDVLQAELNKASIGLSSSSSDSTDINFDISSNVDEKYWADILKKKASLEIEVERLREDLADNVVEMSTIRQENENLKVELGSLQNASEEIIREVQYREDLVNNLSLQLAKAKNSNKFSITHVEKLSKENEQLRADLKKLHTAKGKLETTVVKIKQEKDKLERELTNRESLIQAKIDEIWEIKESLDQTFRKTKLTPPGDEIELPPILVSSETPAPAVQFNPGMEPAGFNGRVVSVNKENNFVIVDVGANSGISLGNTLAVYRGAKFIGKLKVIQVRTDIAAADITEQSIEIQAGDTVR